MISLITPTPDNQRQQIRGGFGVPGPHQHPTRAGPQRENVSRTAEIYRLPRRVGQCPHRGGPISGRHPRTRADVVHRNGERRVVHIGVPRHHQRQPQHIGPLRAHRGTHNAGAVPHEKRHLPDADQLRRPDEVTLILPISIIGHHHQLASGERRNRTPNRLNRGYRRRCSLLAHAALDQRRRATSAGKVSTARTWESQGTWSVAVRSVGSTQR